MSKVKISTGKGDMIAELYDNDTSCLKFCTVSTLIVYVCAKMLIGITTNKNRIVFFMFA